MSAIYSIQNALQEQGRCNSGKCFTGCNEHEIKALMRCQFVKQLPPIYVDFMRQMGKGNFCDFLSSWICNYEDIVIAKQDAICQHYGDFTVRLDMFVFAMSDGKCTTFLYFITGTKDDDPTVYLYDGNEKQSRVYAQSLSAFYQSELDKMLAQSGDN